jgi:hypothetical protein
VYGTQLYTSNPSLGLNPGYSYNNDTGIVAFSDSPTNYTYLWVGLYEFTGSQYALSDYQNIPVSLYFGPTSPSVDPPSINSISDNKWDVARGSTVYLTVSATGENVSYQWQYRRSSSDSWADVSNSDMSSFSTGAQSEQLTLRYINERINNVIYSYFGNYRVVISNSGGSVSAEVSVWEQSDPNAPPPPPPSDSDGDGIPDNEDDYPNDYDNDGIDDPYETNTGTFVSSTDTGTNPNVVDTDGDGLSDGYEVSQNINPLLQDTDSDGLNDFLEVETLGSNPLLVDSDSDGLEDGQEYALSNIAFDVNSDSTVAINALQSSGFLLKSTLAALSMNLNDIEVLDETVNLVFEVKETDSNLNWDTTKTHNMAIPITRHDDEKDLFFRVTSLPFPEVINSQ